MEAGTTVLQICICAALLSWISHAHLVPLSVTKHLPLHFIQNPEHIKYELEVLTVWNFCQPVQDLNPQPSTCKLSALTTRPPSTQTTNLEKNSYAVMFEHEIIFKIVFHIYNQKTIYLLGICFVCLTKHWFTAEMIKKDGMCKKYCCKICDILLNCKNQVHCHIIPALCQNFRKLLPIHD